MKRNTKTPGEDADFGVNWGPFLAKDSDTIAQSTWDVDPGITVGVQQNDDTTTKIWLTGGTIDARYAAMNRIVTAGGRTWERTIYIDIVETKAA